MVFCVFTDAFPGWGCWGIEADLCTAWRQWRVGLVYRVPSTGNTFGIISHSYMVYLTKRFYMYNLIQMLPYFCSDIDHRWHKKGAKTKNVAQGNSSVCHWVSQEDSSW